MLFVQILEGATPDAATPVVAICDPALIATIRVFLQKKLAADPSVLQLAGRQRKAARSKVKPVEAADAADN